MGNDPAPAAAGETQDLHEALQARLTLPVGEADVALLAELLVGKSRGERFQQAPTKAASPRLRLAVARVLSVGCLRFLLQSGGGRARTVLRDGRRRHGRLWDRGLNDGFSATFSEMPFDLLWNLATVVLPLAERRQETLQRTVLTELTRDERRVLTRARPKQATAALDHVFCVLAIEHKNALRLPDVIDEIVRFSLITSSPLALLFNADEALGTAHEGTDIGSLCAPGRVRLLEVCDDALGQALVKRLRHIWTRSADRGDFAIRCRSLAANATALVRGLDDTRRLDLLGPVARLVAALPDELPRDARARLMRLPGVVTMADRDAVVAALQDVVGLALVLDEVRGRLQSWRYGDDRYEEAQVALRVLDDTLTPRRDAVAALARAVSGAVG